ncbi:hypothetical protein MLD38_039373 [Melastoma candidum]|uniref:Uncharacterized protein n=1 Tax=Melastoma candidum TaxID=119954 RepID=A0ACB9L389_9MYRT|nr:hypothetical protein MLD38_039373 [Melastoma candidum]
MIPKLSLLSSFRRVSDTQGVNLLHCRFCSGSGAVDSQGEIGDICSVVAAQIGGLDDLELRLDRFGDRLRSSDVSRVIDRCRGEAHDRRLLRFFSWARGKLGCGLGDGDFNHAIRVFAEKKDHVAMGILMSDLTKDGRELDKHTFGVVVDVLVRLGREDEALGIFKNLERFSCPQDSETVVSIVTALCSKGHAKKAEGVLRHHRSKLQDRALACVYKCLLHGWCVKVDPKEARRIIKEMRLSGIMLDIFCFNTFLKCLCEKNLKKNPSGLVPEALNVMMEMRSYNIIPNNISYNVLLSCLGRARRVKESCRVLDLMMKSGCDPDWSSYYLVVRTLYLSGRFGKGNEMVDEMIGRGLLPDHKFYYHLVRVLCGVDRVNHALELFKQMKRSSGGGYGPIYEILIPKLGREGDFTAARELWDEAESMGIALCCSRDLLSPEFTEVFKPTRKAEAIKLSVGLTEKPRRRKPVKLRSRPKRRHRRVKPKLKLKRKWNKTKTRSA